MISCTLCDKQAKRSQATKPHALLRKMDEKRIFGGTGQKGFEQQDYECMQCQTRFTHSTDKNDFGWTLWQG